MLQPRNAEARVATRGCNQRRHGNIYLICTLVTLIVAFSQSVVFVAAQFIDLEASDLRPTPSLRFNDPDVTTVLLVDTKDRAAQGKFLNIRPEIGLIKSTARTFIQDGVTTEYATQVVGTTLDNGLYAQLLTTTSRVLYENDTPQTRLPILQHNEIVADKDWKKIDVVRPGFIKNIDFISPNDPYVVYPSQKHEPPRPYFEHEPLPESLAQVAEPQLAKRQNDVEAGDAIVPRKVIADVDLPTFTVSHKFAPSGLPRPETPPKPVTEESPAAKAERTGKVLFRGGIPETDLSQFSTVTYYGFADFTTVVGDTVIVFSPSTATPFAGGQVTSIKGEATIQETTTKPPEIRSSSVVPEPVVVKPTVIVEPVTPEAPNTAEEEVSEEVTTSVENTSTESYEEELEKKLIVLSREQDVTRYDSTVPTVEELELTEPVTTPKLPVVTPEVIEPSEAVPEQKPMLSVPTQEDILRALASLAAQQPAEKTPELTETKVSGGVTTIFFDDDPFNMDIEPTEVLTQKPASEVPVTEKEPTTTPKAATTTPKAATTPETSDTTVKTGDTTPKTGDKVGDTTVKTADTTVKAAETTPKASLETTTSKEDQKTTLPDTTEAVTVLETTTETSEEEEVEESEEEEDETTLSPLSVIPLTPKSTPKEPQLTEEELKQLKEDIGCSDEIQILPSTVFRTLTYLTTYFIPDPENEDSTSTSINANTQVNTEVQYRTACVAPSGVVTPETLSTAETTTLETSTEEADSTTELTTTTEPEDEDYEDEEVDVIYKTLYTTYTYLTTFFVDSTTSVSSRKEVVTNVITQTIDPVANSELFALINGMTDEIRPTKTGKLLLDQPTDVGIGRPTTAFSIPESDLIGINQLLGEQDSLQATPTLDEKYLESGPQTLYTTYTYFTTVFVDGETEISSRTEVYSNVLNAITPTAEPSDVKPTDSPAPLSQNDIDENEVLPKYSTMTRNPGSGEDESPLTMITDVKSSSSNGDSMVLERIPDQESSESNTEEVFPSPTLLLQTSYTTFTYFTTLFANPTSSKIESRLETITNVVTETILPTQTVQLSDDGAPITYFTTFTYWTTLFKDGTTTTTSREETISNVVSPTATPEEATPVSSISPTSTSETPLQTSEVASLAVSETVASTVNVADVAKSEKVVNSEVASTQNADLDPSTFYTTYTYFTTSYVGDETVLNSRFETVTNVVTPTPVQPDEEKTSRALDLTPNRNNLVSDDKKEPAYIFPSSNDESPAQVVEVNLSSQPTGVLLVNEGKIVDADGISTILYTTKTIGTYINDLYTQVEEKTSSFKVDEVKKALKTVDPDGAPPNRRTGLVRLYDGTIVANRTTTLYESKVIGTFIDGKYAQIIESTSSYLIEKTLEPSLANEIQPTSVSRVPIQATPSPDIAPTPTSVESSVSDSTEHEEGDEEGEEEIGEDGKKSRLSYTPKKPSFTPVIRPFASRGRPTFNPSKKKTAGPATITRSDITPTITATPALKAESTRNRFSSGRKSSSVPVVSSSQAASSGSRRFARPGRVSSTPALSSSATQKLKSSSIRPTASLRLGSSRPGGIRSSSVVPRLASSAIPAPNSRFSRPRPSQPALNTLTTTSDSSQEQDATTLDVTQEPTDLSSHEEEEEEVTTTTENSRRRGNPLLNLRRPPLNRPAIGGAPPTRPSVQISTRRNPLSRTSKVTTTTTTTTTSKPKARNFARPSVTPISTLSRPRPGGNNLFPPRGLLRTTQAPKPEEEEEEEVVDDNENDFSDESEPQASEVEEVVEPQKAKSPLIKPFVGFRRRVRRQVNYGNRYNSRYRKQSTYDYYEDDVTEAPPKPSPRTTPQRFRGRSSNLATTQSPQNSRIRPTPASSQQARSQFTLRDSQSNVRTSNFRRPPTAARRASSTRASAARYNQYGSGQNRNSLTNRGRTTTSARRTSSRTRAPKVDPYVVQNDGTITVTHHIPTETKIPVVNNGQTEYKNIITEKTSLEVLGPKQYYSTSDANGKVVTLLTAEVTAVNQNGLTEVTQFMLFETPTTSVTFTPTTIRGRKTSFSHVVPSTVYDVHPTVSVNQGQLAANAPLANILLSQLLLGQGLQQAQPTLNPLLAFQQQQQLPQLATQAPNTPVTEFKVRTTTYETTLTSEISTILPLTFHGKAIMTTIVETSTSVITATEFLTDTIVVTPTQVAPQQPQLNSLLLPLLQQIGQQQQQVALPDLTPIQDNLQESDERQFDNIQSIRDDTSKSKEVDEYDTYDDLSIRKAETPVVVPAPNKNFKKFAPEKPAKAQAVPKTSIVTLYVSGRRPGEFSTVLSSYVIDDDSSLSKRSASYATVDDLVDVYEAEASSFDDFYLAGTNEINLESSQQPHEHETASLESVMGPQSTSYFLA